MSELAKWYVVHTYSGYENSVAANILKAAENRKMQDLIQEVNIPMETVKEITDSGEKTVERKVFPGYVLVKMVLTDESWHLVHNVRGAAGFVGSDGKAIPLTEQEIYDLGVEHHEVVVGYELGDSVKITDGPLEGFIGTVDELEPDKDRVRVVVSMFGRETPGRPRTRSGRSDQGLKSYKKEVLSSGTENSWIRQIPGSRRQGNAGSPRSAPRSASMASTLASSPRTSTSAPRATWA